MFHVESPARYSLRENSTFKHIYFSGGLPEVIIYSPFIRLEKLKTTLNLNLLDTLGRKGVRLRLTTLPTPCNRPVSESDEIFHYLNYLEKLFPNFFYYEVQKDLHAKTLLSDDDFCCEGSLNWLSAVNDDSHEANQCEISVALRGGIATQLLQGHNPPLQIPAEEIPDSFAKGLIIKSGERFGSPGYSVRYKENYLTYKGHVAYYSSPAQAKSAAYKKWGKYLL